MAITQDSYTATESQVSFNIPFPYLEQTDVVVRVNGVLQATSAYTFSNATTILFNTAPGAGAKVLISRNTNNDNKKATFYPGSAIKAEDLNDNLDQILYVSQEVDNNSMSTLGDTPMQGDLPFGQGLGITFEGSTNDDYETKLGVIDPTADRTINLPDVSGTVITTGDTNTVTAAMLDNDALLTTEEVQDIVGGMVSSNSETNIEVTYDDTNGKLNFSSTDTNTQLTTEEVQDIVGGMVSGNTENNIEVTYDDTNGKLNFNSTDTNTVYTNSDVDTHLNQSSASSNEILSWNGSDYAWIGQSTADTFTSPDGTTKIEITNDDIKLKDVVEVVDSQPNMIFYHSDGTTPLGQISHGGSSGAFSISQRISGQDFRFKATSGTSSIYKMLFRKTGGGNGIPDVYIGRSMTTTEDGSGLGKPEGLNAMFPASGGVELYYVSGSTGTKKFETTANGVTVQGSVTTEDINMSNLNANANEVDNTKGSWTIQEGASDLFLINRVNGKKYKFNLTEIT